MAGTPKAWSPLRQLEDFQREFDELFDRFLQAKWRSAKRPRSLPIVSYMEGDQSYTEGDQLVIRADLPGVDPNDVEIMITGNMLRITGRREPSKESEKQGRIRQQFTYGPFERAITLPQGVTPEQIKASYRNGVLELRIRLAGKPAARKVTVRVENE